MPKHLPERVVPGHNRQNHAQGLKDHIASAGIGRDHFRLQHIWGVRGIVVTNPGAFFDFGPSAHHGLSHFPGHNAGILTLIFHQDPGCRLHQGYPVIKARPPPGLKGMPGFFHGTCNFSGCHFLVCTDGFPGCRINRC
ncbi:MAG: hypothetical protein P8X85_25820 [Desulfobacterales bacterium]